MLAGIERVKVELELPKPVYEFLRKAVKEDEEVHRLLQDEFECALRGLFDFYGWSWRFSEVSGLLKKEVADPEFNPEFEPLSDEEIEQKIREALRSRM